MNGEEFLTLCKKTEGHLNLRPLNLVSNDPNDPSPLCPADFLKTGSRFKDLLPMEAGESAMKYAKGMRDVMEKLWTLFEEEYVQTLSKEKKLPKGQYNDLKVGDVVYILSKAGQKRTDTYSFPGLVYSTLGRYRVGRIVQEHPGKDDISRVYVVEHGPRSKEGNMQLSTHSYMSLAPAEKVE